jgi:hypothetical protein
MASPHVRFPLGPPTSGILGWFALACVAAPVPFAIVGVKSPVLFAVLVIATVASVSLAIAHRVRTRPRGWIVIHAWGIERIGLSRSSVRFADAFGITVLASQARRRALLAVTTPTQTRFIGVRLEGPSAAALLEHASIVADGDALAAHASTDDSMSAEGALALLRIVRERAPMAQRRLFLSGTRGERIVLDGAELRVEAPSAPPRRIDLHAPVEWRGFVFHEALGAAASIYQATWARQGTAELVFVAPLPTELLLSAKRTDGRDVSATRRVLQAMPDEPPPTHLRTGIERVFMLPVREALARAPRPARPAPKRVSSPDLGV